MSRSIFEIRIHGFVQGLGVRPALARLAEQFCWRGAVRNDLDGVLLTIADVPESACQVESLIRNAHIGLLSATIHVMPSDVDVPSGFCIDASQTEGEVAVPVPRDTAVCADCLQEFHDERNRRFRHSLISCTRCGPRFSILEAMPFDRGRTTLDRFTFCPKCQQEYTSSDDRRGHAQTIGCPQCGPQVWAADRQQRTLASEDAACRIAASALLEERIVAVRGVGGYQLLVDATDERAVQELRCRKRRVSKPLAILCRSIREAESLAVLNDCARQALTSPTNPIVLAPWRSEAPLAPGIHPCLADVGLMLPATAVHDRLLELVGRPLVCTSGNVEGAPLAVTVEEAHSSLVGITNLWLHHDRPIAHPLDDSVVRPIAGRAVTIRCARGLAPLPLPIAAAPPLIALGGHQKSAIAWSNGVQAALGPHIGDLNDLATRDRRQDAIAGMSRLYEIDDPHWAIDGHPDDVAAQYLATSVTPITVWHHHAHIAAAMLEHGWLDGPVLGIAADGLGYGPDGGLWGGEALWATATGFRRIASTRPFALPGGEAAVLDASRVAIALLSQLPEVSQDELARWTGLQAEQAQALRQASQASITPRTSSLGRLFDGVACLVLQIPRAGFVGEPAARLEAICDSRVNGAYSWEIHADRQPWGLDWRPMLRLLLRDVSRGELPGTVAERFHRGVAEWILELHRRCPPRPLVVGGGVFQNRRLCELLVERWPTSGPPLGLPGMIPPNDGGLSAGQLAIAAARLASGMEGSDRRQFQLLIPAL